MQQGQLQAGMRVAVANLDHIPKNYISFAEAPATFAHAPHVFKAELFDNRQGRVTQLGTVKRFYAGHVSVVFVVEHDDGVAAIYHYRELARPEELEAALAKRAQAAIAAAAEADGESEVDAAQAGQQKSSPLDEFTEEVTIGDGQPFFRATVRGTVVEAYVGLDLSKVEADALIAPFVDAKPTAEQLDEPVHKAIHDAAGDWFHSRLEALGDNFGPCAVKHIEGPTGEQTVAFKSVVFVNGVTPEPEAMASAFQGADDARSKTVILPYMAFIPGFEGTLRADKVLQAIMSIIATMADVRGTDFALVKVVF